MDPNSVPDPIGAGIASVTAIGTSVLEFYFQAGEHADSLAER